MFLVDNVVNTLCVDAVFEGQTDSLVSALRAEWDAILQQEEVALDEFEIESADCSLSESSELEDYLEDQLLTYDD